MTLQRLQQAVYEHLRRYPVDASGFLAIIAKALTDYELAVKAQRDCIATNAIMTLMGAKRPAFMQETCFLIHAAFYQFPNGLQGHSPVEKRFWEDFLAAARKSEASGESHREWLARNPIIQEWYVRVVTPALNTTSESKAKTGTRS